MASHGQSSTERRKYYLVLAAVPAIYLPTVPRPHTKLRCTPCAIAIRHGDQRLCVNAPLFEFVARVPSGAPLRGFTAAGLSLALRLLLMHGLHLHVTSGC